MRYSEVVRRFAAVWVSAFVYASVTFVLLRFAPGGPFDGERVFPTEIQANLERRYGLDQPLASQYWMWAHDVFRGDLRESFQFTGRPVSEMISESLPASMELGLVALAFAAGIGIPVGAFAASRRGTWWDHAAVFITGLGLNLPSFLFASVLILFFSVRLGWLPSALWDGPESVVLPALTLAARPLAMIARLTRTSTIEALASDYVRTARAKGVHPASVVLKHALANSLLPVVALLGPLAANLVTGSFLVESVFQVPGLGRHFVGGVLNRDYPLVTGITLVYGIVLLTSNLLADLIAAGMDRRR